MPHISCHALVKITKYKILPSLLKMQYIVKKRQTSLHSYISNFHYMVFLETVLTIS